MFYFHTVTVPIGCIMVAIVFKFFCNGNLQQRENPGKWIRATNQTTIKKYY